MKAHLLVWSLGDVSGVNDGDNGSDEDHEPLQEHAIISDSDEIPTYLPTRNENGSESSSESEEYENKETP